VNLSASNIIHPNIISNINKVLLVTSLEPEILWLEITEKASAPDDKGAIGVLKNYTLSVSECVWIILTPGIQH